MSTNSDSEKDITEVVINVGYSGFRLTDHMMKKLKIEDPFPSKEELPRHDKKLVELVRAGHGTVVHKGKKQGLIVKTITEDMYRICDYDGYEWIETPDTIKWIKVSDYYVHPSQAHRVHDDGWVD